VKIFFEGKVARREKRAYLAPRILEINKNQTEKNAIMIEYLTNRTIGNVPDTLCSPAHEYILTAWGGGEFSV
jgi:hypothetical protein